MIDMTSSETIGVYEPPSDPPPGGDIEDNTSSENGLHCFQVKQVAVVDGLLCNIIKALSTSSSDCELISAIERKVPEVEVKTSWWKFFNYFEDAIDEARKIKIKILKGSQNAS